MPGPVSDSYDPEFSTGERASDVRRGIQDALMRINKALGPELKPIVDVAQATIAMRPKVDIPFSEKDLRCLRFAALRGLESV